MPMNIRPPAAFSTMNLNWTDDEQLIEDEEQEIEEGWWTPVFRSRLTSHQGVRESNQNAMGSTSAVPTQKIALNGMQKHRRITVARLDNFIASGQFQDVSLRSMLWKQRTSEGIQLLVYSVPDLKRMLVNPLVQDCEAMIYTTTGTPLQGITGTTGSQRHVDYELTKSSTGGETYEFCIEVACNGLLGINGISAPYPNKYYTLKTCEIGVRDLTAWKLFWDLEVLIGIVKEVTVDSQLNCDALYMANRIVNIFQRGNRESLEEAHNLAREFFESRSTRSTTSHVVTAIGHCHIDTARSFATQIKLMESRPSNTSFKFTHSQAQQFEWVEENYPELFEKVKDQVHLGRFIPVGGAWVEMDCNLPSGNGTLKVALGNVVTSAGCLTRLVLLDDTTILTHFSPADTQTAQATVRDVVFSAKNHKDKEYSPHSLLLYGNGDGGGGPLEGMIERLERIKDIDGVPAIVRFGGPEEFFEGVVDGLKKEGAAGKELVYWNGELYLEFHRGTYTSQSSMKLRNRKAEILLRDIEILSAWSTLISLSQSTRHQPSIYPTNELHHLWKLVLLNQFHDVLPGSAIKLVVDEALEIYREVEEVGERLMTGAVDGVLRGLVWEASNDNDGDMFAGAISVINTTSWPISSKVIELDNLSEVEMSELKRVSWSQVSSNNKPLVFVNDIPAMSLKTFNLETATHANNSRDSSVTVYPKGGIFVMENNLIRVKVNQDGEMTSLFDKVNRRESITPGQPGNVFRLFEDIPFYYDAWDLEVYHLEKGWKIPSSSECSIKIIETGPLRVGLSIQREISKTSKLEQRVFVSVDSFMVEFDTKVFWNENRMCLKVEFPFQIKSNHATYETQFGHVQRPTHYNTSWDLAKFEVCGHRFGDLSEFGYGVAIVNDCKYGYSCKDNVMRLTLLRAPKAPDDTCDIGSFLESDVVKVAQQFNIKPIVRTLTMKETRSLDVTRTLFTIDQSNVVLDTIKMAEDAPLPSVADGVDIVLRLYEAYGGRGFVCISTPFKILEAKACNILEDVIMEQVDSDGSTDTRVHSVEVTGGGCCCDKSVIKVWVDPFKVLSLKVK
ncbi:Alpha-mannosidase 2C1, partial [Blyttiomyces sp. JEL0837]